MAPALMVCWIEGAAPAFSFWRYCLAAPRSSYRVDRGRHLALSAFAGVAQCRALSPDFPAGARGLYPLARGPTNPTGARDGTRADGVLDRGRRRLFSFWRYCLAAPSSYRVDGGGHPGLSAFAGVAQCRALSPGFPAGARGLTFDSLSLFCTGKNDALSGEVCQRFCSSQERALRASADVDVTRSDSLFVVRKSASPRKFDLLTHREGRGIGRRLTTGVDPRSRCPQIVCQLW